MPISFPARRLALLLVLALPLPLVAQATDAAHRAKAQEMMSILHTQRMVQNISDNIKKQIGDAADKVTGPTATPEQKAKLADFEKQAAKLIDAQLSWESLRSGFTDIYAKSFTDEELDGIIAFYKTPGGIALLAKMPDVNTQVGQFGSSHMSTLQPQLKDLFDAFQKSAAAAAPATSTTDVPQPAPVSKPLNTPK